MSLEALASRNEQKSVNRFQSTEPVVLDKEIDSPGFLLIPTGHPFHASYGEVSEESLWQPIYFTALEMISAMCYRTPSKHLLYSGYPIETRRLSFV